MNPFFGLVGGRKRRGRKRRGRRRNRNGRRRRRNPSIPSGPIAMVPMLVGGGVGFLASRFIPQNVAVLQQYNAGWTGYAMNAAVGWAVSWGGGKLWDSIEPGKGKSFATGGYIGTGVAVLSRIITEQFGGASASGTSGDLEYDLGYYLQDRFPWPQGSGGPYDQFPGTPYAGSGPFPVTSATAVRAGQSAAAALPAAAAAAAAAAPGVSGLSNGRWAVSRWT